MGKVRLKEPTACSKLTTPEVVEQKVSDICRCLDVCMGHIRNSFHCFLAQKGHFRGPRPEGPNAFWSQLSDAQTLDCLCNKEHTTLKVRPWENRSGSACFAETHTGSDSLHKAWADSQGSFLDTGSSNCLVLQMGRKLPRKRKWFFFPRPWRTKGRLSEFRMTSLHTLYCGISLEHLSKPDWD